ncbi:hypothetical protein LEP1GSC193_0293 [Leptospira alstonii serovar Pingchang str. 80-412]|uniref:Uncharacterized protein n=2 Tax=Leptospira alstonii TaxID=28452 RepID=M6CWP6_9LEPT|nr:hypothetical protein LEP1GSC194_1654 [Leptospira alstonii serovar Sichuan str. 79601]EQA80819.1 hypothetical protein LEP1GSC193_0293 [Leptospira alstonii serovar Pingchang str. 80-412]
MRQNPDSFFDFSFQFHQNPIPFSESKIYFRISYFFNIYNLPE